MKAYNTGKADNIDVLFHYEVNDITTIKNALNNQYSNNHYDYIVTFYDI